MTISCTCGGMSTVKRSQAFERTIRRRRACHKCNARWTTIEITEAEYAKLNDLASAVQNLVQRTTGGQT